MACDREAADRLHREVGELIEGFLGELDDPGLRLELYGTEASVEEVRVRLARAATWSPEAYADEARRYRETYPEEVTILPPHRAQDVVVMPAVGCPWARCKFCAFYQDRSFRVLTAEEFEAHLGAVQQLLGRSETARDGVFLGSASAVSLGRERLLAVLEQVGRVLGARKRAVAAFHDPDHAPRRSAEEYRELREAGLADVTIGLETGLPALRAEAGKSEAVDRIVETAALQRDADLKVAVTVLVGIGGPERAAEHRVATVAAVRTMALRKGDVVYLSPLLGSLSGEVLERELGAFRVELRAVSQATVAPYHMELFEYYA